MTEAFVTTRDAMVAVQVGAQKVWPGGLPPYAAPDRPRRSGEDLFRDFAHLVRDRTH